jgi:hypothetical protein
MAERYQTMATSASKIAVRCKVRPGGWSQGYPQDVELMVPRRGRQVPLVTKVRAAERGGNASVCQILRGEQGFSKPQHALRGFRVDGAARPQKANASHAL